MKVLAYSLLAVPAAGFVAQQSKRAPLDALRSTPQQNTYTDMNTADYSNRITTGSAMGMGDRPSAAVSAGRSRVSTPTPVRKVNQNDPFETNGMPIAVQGGSLKTWSFEDPRVQRAQVVLGTSGRPLNAKIELWQGPDNSPYKLDCYLEDGALRPLKCMIELPGGSNTVAVRNEGHIEFPIQAKIEPGLGDSFMELGKGRIVQGGAVYTTPFDPDVQSVKLVLQTDGRPMTARIELMQGPYNDKQVMEVYSEDGLERPFIAVIETPGVGNVVRLVNTATVEFPLRASVEPYDIDYNE